MKKHSYTCHHQPCILRIIAAFLAFAQLLTSLPMEIWAGTNSTRVKSVTPSLPPAVVTPQNVNVNRTAPKVQAPRLLPFFSDWPTNAQISAARVFEEPLIRLSGSTSARENKALAQALTAFAQRTESEDTSALTGFLNRYSRSTWRAALLTNLGLLYQRTGFTSQALAAWEEAWRLAKNESEPSARTLADRAAGELADLTARLGHESRLASLLAELDSRDVHGAATERVTVAREVLWQMRHAPETALRCGLYALGRVCAAQGATQAAEALWVNGRATRHGTALTQLVAWADQAHLRYQMAWRRPGAPVRLPAVVHWKVGHYGALIREQDGRYLVQDPTLDPTSAGELWISPAALDAEASGYFLVPEGRLPEGWRAVPAPEGQTVWGKGLSSHHPTNGPDPNQTKAGGCPPEKSPDTRMAGYAFHVLLASLNITDTPVGYAPPRGPAVPFKVTYNQREANQPATFDYSNLGPKWTFDWLSFITDDPARPADSVRLYLSGGGIENYTGFSSTRPTSDPQLETAAVLVRNAPTGYTRYERQLPDGAKQIFDRAYGTAFPRRIFMTQFVDPTGNAVTLSYDDQIRLTTITDAIGQSTTLSYERVTDPLKITKVTDPFGRFATFEYDGSGQLIRITDVIRLASEFSYGAGNFITTLRTPYGATQFAAFDRDAVHRWLQATDPLGGIERVEFRQDAPGIAQSDPVGSPGSEFTNGNLLFRNSFYWNRKAWQDHPNDYTKARIYHWLHGVPTSFSSNVLESEKNPLENRVWYRYAGQGSSIFLSGVRLAKPIKVARVLDDGSTQLYQYEYNALGHITRATDPVGRVFSYVYAPNQIDLLEVRQTRGTNNELLARFTYNAQHLRLTATDASGQTTNFTYNAFGQLLTVRNPRNETTTLTYNADGYLTRITGPLPGSTTDFTYDGFGRVRTITDSEGYTLTFDYDDLDRLIQTTYPDGTSDQIIYDRLDPGQIIDRLGRITLQTYDARRQLVQIQDALQRITQFEWCRCGGLQKITDPMGRVTQWNYDAQSRVVSKVYPDNRQVRYRYENATGRLAEVADAQGQKTEYEYYPDNRVRQVSYVDAVVDTPPVAFTYDPNYDRALTMRDGTGTTTYAYNPITPTPTLGAGRLASVTGPLPSSTITYAYDELGRIVRRAVNGAAVDVAYDALGRVTQEANPLGAFVYRYVRATDRLDSMSYPNGQSTTFRYYDNQGDQRLREIKHLNPAAAVLSQFNYTYDAVGQITNWTRQVDAQPPVSYDFEYDPVDQLLRATSASVDASQYVFAYDSAANRTSEQIDDAVTLASYNNLNQLISQQVATLPDPDPTARRSEITYDGLGRRVRIVERENDALVSDKRFVWCNEELCEERDATGGTVTKGFYAQGVQSSGSNYFYTRDHQGSIREMTDGDVTGAVRARYDYDPFGRRTKVSGDLDADFAFTGHYFHGPSGLHLALYRAYDANLGRWISRDPIGEAGGVNLYGYVRNNPVNLVDPDGRLFFALTSPLIASFLPDAAALQRLLENRRRLVLDEVSKEMRNYMPWGFISKEEVRRNIERRIERRIEIEERREIEERVRKREALMFSIEEEVRRERKLKEIEERERQRPCKDETIDPKLMIFDKWTWTIPEERDPSSVQGDVTSLHVPF